jgi:hypothetical protein
LRVDASKPEAPVVGIVGHGNEAPESVNDKHGTDPSLEVFRALF